MVNVTRFTPFEDSIDDLFRGFFVRPVAFEGDQQRTPQFRMDVTEEGSNYVVHADIPGVKKEDIQITIDGNQVAIAAEVRRTTEERQGARLLKSERYYGKVSRNFTLASELDSGAAQARYADGVLELILPKKVATSAKQLAVQ